MFEFRHQPLRSIYLTVVVLWTVVRLPYWTACASIPPLRPRKSWPVSRTLIVHLLREFVSTWFWSMPSVLEGQNLEEIAASADAEKLGFVWVEPVAENLLKGEVLEIAKINQVVPRRTFGCWYQSEGLSGRGDHKAGPDEKVILHFHGGAYISGSPSPKSATTPPVCNGLLAHCKGLTRIFACGYRLSSSAPFPSANPFPAALLDGLAGYYYLLHTVGFRAENVIISGDSAGGNLTVALIRYLAMSEFPDVPVPGAALLLSPTVDWAVTHDKPGSSIRYNAATDFCGACFRGYTKQCLTGNLPPDTPYTSAWISPASLKLPESEGLFKGFSKTYITVGDAELHLTPTLTFRDRLIADVGQEKVTYNEVKDATHDLLTMEWHEPERTATIKHIASWIESL